VAFPGYAALRNQSTMGGAFWRRILLGCRGCLGGVNVGLITQSNCCQRYVDLLVQGAFLQDLFLAVNWYARQRCSADGAHLIKSQRCWVK